MMKPADRPELRRFFNLPSNRALAGVLRDLRLRPVAGRVPWPLVWEALGLAGEQDPAHWAELAAPLMTAGEVAEACGVTPRSVHRWRRGAPPDHASPMPEAIDLSGGRAQARRTRWRRAEIRAWQLRRPLPVYARPAPVPGALRPPR